MSGDYRTDGVEMSRGSQTFVAKICSPGAYGREPSPQGGGESERGDRAECNASELVETNSLSGLLCDYFVGPHHVVVFILLFST
jgi:hypothetical protein